MYTYSTDEFYITQQSKTKNGTLDLT